jgi:alkyl hydroperoxide reductase subunit AhpC
VLYQLPESRPRMSQIAGREGTLAMLGVEVIAVPTDADRDAIRRLGEDPRVLFPVVTDGAEAIVTTYRLFAAAPHTEFLIDRQGYVRTIAKSRGQAEEMEPLLAQIQELNQERVPVEPPPDEHVH